MVEKMLSSSKRKFLKPKDCASRFNWISFIPLINKTSLVSFSISFNDVYKLDKQDRQTFGDI